MGPKTINFIKWTIQLLEETVWESLSDFGLRKELLDKTSKAQSVKEKNDKLDFNKVLNFCSLKTQLREWKEKPQNGRKYLQIILLKRDLYPE